MSFLKVIIGYAEEEGFSIYGNYIFSNGLKFEIVEFNETLTVYLNNHQEELYLIKSNKDCINFCLILSTLLNDKKTHLALEGKNLYN
ncbi:TPA: hypothetical protein KDZ30_001237 [Vibrio alginolyticus]|nr:hypothetical protein [Vibrio alginolyticus]